MPVDAQSVAIALPDVPDVASKEKLAWEKELLGIYLSDHPLQAAASQLLDIITAQTSELSDDLVGQKVTVGGLLKTVRSLITKKKDAMVSSTLEDLTGTVELVAFPRTYEKTREEWVVDAMVIVSGKLDVREERFQLIVDSIEPIVVDDERPRPTLAPVVQISAYQANRRASEVVSEVRSPAMSGQASPGVTGPPRPPTTAVEMNGAGGNGRRTVVLQMRRSSDEQADVKRLSQVSVLLHERAGGGDAVEMILTGENRPRVILEWPSLKIRWDRQLQRQLEALLGAASVQVEQGDDESQRATAP
jgi:OB-fold nucleic acid binding protein